MHGIKLQLLLLATVLVAWVHAEEIEYYDDKYDYINAMEVLENDKLREQYYKCFMDLGPCVTADAKFFKSNFADVIATKCKRCTQKQKENFDIMADWYIKNDNEKWDKFVAKYLEEAKKHNAE